MYVCTYVAQLAFLLRMENTTKSMGVDKIQIHMQEKNLHIFVWLNPQ